MIEPVYHEKILIDGLKEGNEKIFDYLFHYYYSGLVVFSFKFLKNMDAAEDVVQDYFLQLWQNRSHLTINQSLKSYFFTAIKNKSLDYLKHQKIGRRVEDELKYFQSETISNKDLMVESELEAVLKKSLDKLPEKCKKAFILNRFEGLKPTEIAEKMNISVRTVEGHIGKAIKSLRKELKPYISSLFILLFKKNTSKK